MAAIKYCQRPAGLFDFTVIGEQRLSFILTVLCAGLIPWLSLRPPMVDLPQHAGQVALLHDLATRGSQWESLLTINYFTPYLFGYGCAFLLSFLMPVLATMKLMLTLALYGFVWSCVLLRREFDGDKRLDWFFIPGFFGFAYSWGLFTFLITAPLGLMFILFAHRYANNRSFKYSASILLVGTALFFSHGLVFLFANAVGVVFLLIKSGSIKKLLSALWPFVLQGGLLILYYCSRMQDDVVMPYLVAMPSVVWCLDFRRLEFVSAIWSSFDDPDPVALVLGAFMLLMPIVMKAKFNVKRPLAFVPLALALGMILLMPRSIYMNTMLDVRFSFYIPAFMALIYKRVDAMHHEEQGRLRKISRICLPILCWMLLSVYSVRHLQFSEESVGFEEVLTYMEPGRRAFYRVLDPASSVPGYPFAYLHYALWYQVEKNGFVDPSFAWLMPQIIRFKNSTSPAQFTNYNEVERRFDWGGEESDIYSYLVIRGGLLAPADFFVGGTCKVELLVANGNWSIYEKQVCK